MTRVHKVDLVFDVGGDKVLPAFKHEDSPASPSHIKPKIPNVKHSTLPELMETFVNQHGLKGKVARVFVDVNAPVNDDGSFQPTNGRFSDKGIVTKQNIADATGVQKTRVGTGNDMVAGSAGFLALEFSDDKSNKTLFNTDSRVCTRKSINFMGTGYGHGELIILDDGKVLFLPSEGGHIKWSPWTSPQIKYLQDLSDRGKKVISREVVARSEGIFLAYSYIKKTVTDTNSNKTDLDRKLNEAEKQGESLSKVLTDNILSSEPDLFALAAFDLYESIAAGIVTDEAMRLNGGEVVFGGSHFGPVAHRYEDPKRTFKLVFLDSCEALDNMKALATRTKVTLATNPNMNILGALSLVNDVATREQKYIIVPSRIELT